MLQVAYARLCKAWPDATISVVTHSPRELRARCQGAIPVHGTSRQAWWINHFRSLRPSRVIPNTLAPGLMLLENALRLLFRTGTPEANGHPTPEYSEPQPFLEALHAADLFVVSGQGGLNDEFLEHSTGTLLALDRAIRLGKPTVMLSQGIGPIANPKLRNLARLVLPRVDLIFLRENLNGPRLLQSLGCRSRRLAVTGDDAIELVLKAQKACVSGSVTVGASGPAKWGQSQPELGDAIGVNARLAYYSAVASDDLPDLKQVIQRFATDVQAPLLGLPIWRPNSGGDLSAIRTLLSGYEGEADPGEMLDSPEELIERVSNCRIVITGSYHAAVFALGMGIPVIALSNRPYYDWKFTGLSNQFGGGLAVIPIHDERFKTKLAETAHRFWNTAPEFKSVLIRAALKQIEASRSAFSRVPALVASKQ
jgi:colanic acid/amylovoran biosynthesis protein